MNNFNMDILQKARNSRFILGLSGGVDSMALFHILLAKKIQFKAVYVHHGLREKADEEVKSLTEHCDHYNVNFECVKIDVLAHRKKNKESIEEAARNLRYAALFDVAEKEGCEGVIVAHHFDDQAESILMHLLRGSGLDGLSGMDAEMCPSPFHETIPLLRPLLTVPKEELIQYCVENEIVFHEDVSNQDSSYRRNLIRNEIFPVLEKFNPQVKSKLVQLGRIAKDETKFLEEQTDRYWDEICQFYDLEKPFVEIRRDELAGVPPAIQKRILRKAIRCVRPESKNVGYVTITTMMENIASDFDTNILYFEDHLLLVFMYDVCFLCDEADALAQQYFPQLEKEEITISLVAQEVALSRYDRLVIEEIDQETFSSRDTGDLFCAYIDGDELDKIVVSHKRSGDRMQMLGFGGQSKKIATVLIDIKVHREARAKYPIFRDPTGRILWVPGYKISIDYPVQNTTKKIIKLKLCKQ